MSANRIFAITRRVVGQFRHDHRTLALMFIVPLIIISLFGYVFRSQESQNVKVAIVNQDAPPAGQSRLSESVISDLEKTSGLETKSMSIDNARNGLKDGTLAVALVFPPSFSQDLRTEHKADVRFIVEGSNPSQAGSAIATLGQAVMQSAPTVLKSLVPPQAAALVPQGLPVATETERLYGSANLKPLDYFAPIFIAFIVFFLMFLLTSISFLRERTQGTMERLAASPVTRIELVVGYMLGFGIFAVLQAIVFILFTVFALQINYTGNLLSVGVVTLVLVFVSVNLGILLSGFARNELQAIQFIPIVIIPQVFLCGLLWPVQQMPDWLQSIARLLPLTYATDALTSIMIRGQTLASTWVDLLVLLGFAVVVAVLAAGSVRREMA